MIFEMDLHSTHLKFGSTGFQVARWEDELVEETESALEDISELQGKSVEAETAAFTAKLLFNVSGGDWEKAETMASVLEDFFRNEAPETETKASKTDEETAQDEQDSGENEAGEDAEADSSEQEDTAEDDGEENPVIMPSETTEQEDEEVQE